MSLSLYCLVLWLTGWLIGRKMGLAEYGFEKSCFRVGFVLHIRRERGGREVAREGDREKQKSGQGQGHNSTQLNKITQHNTALEKHNTTQIQT